MSRKNKIVASTASIFFLALLVYVADNNAEALTQIAQWAVYASLPVAGGLATLSISSLLLTFTTTENTATSHLLRRALESPARSFFAGFVFTAYLGLIRSPLISIMSFLPYVEWAAVAMAVYLMYSVTRPSSRQLPSGFERASWDKHVQTVERETGANLQRYASIMEQFVSQGVKEPLLVYLTLYLQRLRETEEEILRTLKPLIDYEKDSRKRKLYSLLFPWTRSGLAAKNRDERSQLLKAIFEKISEESLNES